MEHTPCAFYKEYKKKLDQQYPSVAKASWPLPPVSPFVVPLPLKAKQDMQKVIKLLYKMAHLKKYKQIIQTNHPCYLKEGLPLKALLMAYDFHIDAKGQAQLIEVNTNASGYLVADLVDQVQAPFLAGDNQKASRLGHTPMPLGFVEEWQSFSARDAKGFSQQKRAPSNMVIVDHNILQQKMYVEFLMYRDLLQKQKWPCKLLEANKLSWFEDDHSSRGGYLIDPQNNRVDMVYNRTTDFYLEHLPALKKAFLTQVCCVSPHPAEYVLLADKARLVDWADEGFLKKLDLSKEDQHTLKRAIPWAVFLNTAIKEEIWQKRKTLFFKPLRGFGSKAIYRGKSISRKMFNHIINQNYLAQQAVPPPKFKDPTGTEWKYDIRVYVYGDKVLKWSARVYQGQVTGFKEPLSGIASVTHLS